MREGRRRPVPDELWEEAKVSSGRADGGLCLTSCGRRPRCREGGQTAACA